MTCRLPAGVLTGLRGLAIQGKEYCSSGNLSFYRQCPQQAYEDLPMEIPHRRARDRH